MPYDISKVKRYGCHIVNYYLLKVDEKWDETDGLSCASAGKTDRDNYFYKKVSHRKSLLRPYIVIFFNVSAVIDTKFISTRFVVKHIGLKIDT